MASSVKPAASQNTMSGAEEAAAREKLKQMGNRKAISSADFFNDDQKSAELESKFQEFKLSGTTQISSDMMFGRASGPEKP